MSGDASLSEHFARMLRDYRKLPPRRGPFHERQIQAEAAKAYYQVHNARPDFRADLTALFTQWSELEAAQFVKRWKLGRDGLRDLRFSLDLWCRGLSKEPRLAVGSRWFPASSGSMPEEELKSLGYRRMPSSLRDRAARQRSARRLFKRAVERRSWQRIRDDERLAARSAGAYPYVDKRSITGSVTLWSDLLGVELPTIPRGRPRRDRPTEDP